MKPQKRLLQNQQTRRGFVSGSVAAGAAGMLAHKAGAQATPNASPVTGEEIIPVELTAQPKGTFPLTEEKKTLTVLVANNAWVGNFEDNEFTRWYEEKTNVHIEWTVLPADDASAALNVRLASGDLPDILLSTNPSPSTTQLYGSLGTFIPLNDFIEEHGVYTKYIFEQYPIARTNATAADGNIYALPSVNDCFHCTRSQKLWVNQRLKEALGAEDPQTTEEFAEFLRRIKNEDPNGNGQADEVPLTGSPTAWHGTFDMFFMNAFVFTPESRQYQEDGVVKTSYTQEGWKEGLKYLAGLYAEGLIDPESFTQDMDGLNRQLGADPPIVGAVPLGNVGTLDSNPERWAEFLTIAPLEGPGGMRVAPYDPVQAGQPGRFIITETCSDPELAFRWADGLYEYETSTRSNMGVKDVDWRWAHEGEVGIDGNQAIWTKLTELENTQTQHWSQSGNSYRPSSWRLGQTTDPDRPRTHNGETKYYDETAKNYEPYQSPDDWVLPVLYFTEEQATIIAESETSIIPYVEETMAQAIIGNFDIEGQWQEYLDTLNAMGYENYLAQIQAAFDAKSGAQ